MTEYPLTPPIIAPSILSADFSMLPEEVAIVDPKRDWVHCDVMDHHFVPNLTFGPLVVGGVRRLTTAFVDVHLMIERPWDLAAAFRDAGADQITIHLEACRPEDQPLREFDPKRVEADRVIKALAAVRETGARVGLALKPATPFAAAVPFLELVDLVLIMTVEPGFGGQSFMTDMLDKVREAAAWKRKHGAQWLIEVDGGITAETIVPCRAAGAEVFVAGNAVYREVTAPRAALASLRKSVRSSEPASRS